MGNTFSAVRFPCTFLCTLLLSSALSLKNPLTRVLLRLVVVLMRCPPYLAVPLSRLVGTLLTPGVLFLGFYEHPPTRSMLTRSLKFLLAPIGHRMGMMWGLQALVSRLSSSLQLAPGLLSRPIRKTMGPFSALARWKRPRALILILPVFPRSTIVALAMRRVASVVFMKLLSFG